MTMHPYPDETFDRRADIVDLETVEGVGIHVWLLDDGDVFEVRENRGTTCDISRERIHANDERAWCYRAECV